jgi:hypothetical protein
MQHNGVIVKRLEERILLHESRLSPATTKLPISDVATEKQVVEKKAADPDRVKRKDEKEDDESSIF